MNAQEYIESQLTALNAPAEPQGSASAEELFKLLMSKKFRKFSVPEKSQAIIKAALTKNVSEGAPIEIAWPFGGYKLWRLDEAPESDWAELFTIMYIARWLKPVCAAYTPGVRFTFWVDEVVISRMNNIPQEDLDAYQKSFADLLTFVEPHLPRNLHFDVFLEREQYENDAEFTAGLAKEMEKLAAARAASPQPLSDEARRSIELNVKVAPEQAADPLWREKIDLMHYAYYNLQEQQHRARPSYTSANITAFTTFFEPNVIPIGTTKTSIAKFWVGVGALKKRADGYIETILTPEQLKTAQAVWEPVRLPGLSGKNFSKVRVVA